MVRQLKRSLFRWTNARKGIPNVSEAEQRLMEPNELGAKLSLDVRMPHWSDARQTPCPCGQEVYCGKDEKEEPKVEVAKRMRDCVSLPLTGSPLALHA